MLPRDQLTVPEITRAAWRRRWIIAVPLVVCPFTALIVSAHLPNLYQSDMLIQIIPQRVPDSYVRSTVTLRTDERIQSLSQQILSRTELEKIIRDWNLYADLTARLPMQDVVNEMRRAIKVDVEPSVGGRSPDAFHVQFTYTDPALAARVTSRLGSLFADFNARERSTLAEATDQFLQSQLEDARNRLSAQEKKVEEFRKKNAGKLPSQMDFNMQAIQNAQLQRQALVESLARDRDRKLTLEQLYEDARTQPAAAAAPQAGNAANAHADPGALPDSGSPAQRLQTARELLARLELRLTPEHPDVIRTKRLIADLEKKAADTASARPSDAPAEPVLTPEEQDRRRRLNQMQAEIDSLNRQITFKESEEKRLESEIAEYQRRIEAIPGNETAYVALTRDYNTLQDEYRGLLTKSESAQMAADLERRQIGEQFRVLDPARVPVTPVGPNRMRVNGAGLGLGLLLGLGLAAFLELRDTSFRTAADVLDLLDLPVLAMIPAVETGQERVRRRRRRLLVSATLVMAVGGGTYVFWSMQLWRYLL